MASWPRRWHPEGGTGVDGLEELRRGNYERILTRLERLHPMAGARVLDVGSARGWFIEAALARGAAAQGVEPEHANAELCRERGLQVESGFFPQDLADRGPFELVTFNDVFEHLPEPAAAAVAAEALLRPGGLLVLNVPSSRGALFRLSAVLARLGLPGPYERLWQKEFASPHVSYFARRSLAALIGRHTDLTLVDSFSLPSVSRNGLVARVSGSHGGLVGMGLVAGVWLLSFILPWLPADIEVLVFIREESVAVARASAAVE